MFFSLDVDHASTVGKVRADVVRDDNELLWNIARCTALISTFLDKIDEAFLVKAESASSNIGSVGPVETLGRQ